MSRRISRRTRLAAAAITVLASGGIMRATLIRAATAAEAPMTETPQATAVETPPPNPAPAFQEPPGDENAFADVPAPGEGGSPPPAFDLPAAPQPDFDAVGPPEGGPAPLTDVPTPESIGNPLPSPPASDPDAYGSAQIAPVDAALSPMSPNPYLPDTAAFEPVRGQHEGIFPIATLAISEQAPLRAALLLVTLDCTSEGRLSDIRYLNTSLGNDSEALMKLARLLKERHDLFARAAGEGARSIVQIEAPPALRFEHVQSVARMAAFGGTDIRLRVQGETVPPKGPQVYTANPRRTITVSVVFVRDASRKKLAKQPVICLNDEVVSPGDVQRALQELVAAGPASVAAPPVPTPLGVAVSIGKDSPDGATVPRTVPSPSAALEPTLALVILADSEVAYESLEAVVNAASAVGIETIRLSQPEYTRPGPVYPGHDPASP